MIKMIIGLWGYNKQVNVDYVSGIHEIRLEAERVVKEAEKPDTEIFRVIQVIQSEQLQKYAKDFNLK